MTTIRTTCPRCGEVDLIPDDIELHILRMEGSIATGSTYVFACPTCEGVVRKPADARIAGLLTSGGVRVAGDRQVDVRHPERPPVGAPFTLDDVIDFHRLLASDGWFGALSQV